MSRKKKSMRRKKNVPSKKKTFECALPAASLELSAKDKNEK